MFEELDELAEDGPPTHKTSAERAAWRRRDEKAQACIGWTLADAFLESVREATTAERMWKIVTDVLEKRTLLHQLAAGRRFYTATMSESEAVLQLANRLRQLAGTPKSMCVSGLPPAPAPHMSRRRTSVPPRSRGFWRRW